MSTAAVFVDIEKAFDVTWHLGLLFKLPELHFLAIISSLLAHSFPTKHSELL
jgi:hypothetical protein